ncbi:MAG: ArnT family glycosyltransferase [Fimbriiglobus sp.]
MNRPVVHHLVLLIVTFFLTFPNLGAHSLWDMDEGVNAECGREMMESGTWIVPTFNWELRTAKPVLLYWLQRGSYRAFGVSEWSARFPSALLAFGTVLVTYHLARRMYDALTGFLAGSILASTIQFSILSHAATPDAPLIFFVTLTMAMVWWLHEHGQGWLIWPAIPCGLAVLAKGPVGLGVPGMAILAYVLWNREWKRILSWRFLAGIWLFALVVVPWVGFVAAETRGEWLAKFLKNENVNRMTTAQENHSGPPYYYLVCLLVLFAPWSSVIGVTFWYAVAEARRKLGELTRETKAARYLLLWILAFLIPFSLFATKLPNYIAPLYPALAILTARFLIRWQRVEVTPAKWVMPVAVSGIALTGLGFGVGLLVGSGVIPLNNPQMRIFPGLEAWAWIGTVPLLAAAVMGYSLWSGQRQWFITALAAAAVVLVGVAGAIVVLVVDQQKAPKTLVLTSGAKDLTRDIRLATYGYSSDNQSLVFYAERQVKPLAILEDAKNHLRLPRPAFLFVPKNIWERDFASDPTLSHCRVAVTKYDYLKNTEIVCIRNEP